MTKPIELGCPGHCIVARSCHWRRHTQVGNYRVSTVGNYYPGGARERDTLGAGDDSFFETMVFRTINAPADGESSEGCGCRAVKSYDEIDSQRYATAGAAQAGHEAFVAKYLKRANRGKVTR